MDSRGKGEIRPPASGDSASHVVRWFAHAAPQRIALEVAGEQVDFAQLNRDVDRLAARLLEHAAAIAGAAPAPAAPAGTQGGAPAGAGEEAHVAAQLTAADAQLSQPAVVL
jgi:hypothetical protein